MHFRTIVAVPALPGGFRAVEFALWLRAAVLVIAAPAPDRRYRPKSAPSRAGPVRLGPASEQPPWPAKQRPGVADLPALFRRDRRSRPAQTPSRCWTTSRPSNK